MSSNYFICTWTSEELHSQHNMTPAEFTKSVNARVNETDVIAENMGDRVNLYFLPF